MGTIDFMPATASTTSPFNCADIRHLHVDLVSVKVAVILCGTLVLSLASRFTTKVHDVLVSASRLLYTAVAVTVEREWIVLD